MLLVYTILCEPTRCEVAPRYHVDSWALVGNVANLWMFPNWLAFLYLIILLLIMPTVIIFEILNRIRKYINDRKQQRTLAVVLSGGRS